MDEKELKQRLDKIDEKLTRIEKVLEKGCVKNLYDYVRTLMTELTEIKARL